MDSVFPHKNYRKDIDGLRAVAVLAVLIFHAFPRALPGGFVGVDVFFVLSGFLISGIIVADLERGDFTYASFYSRRIRRIFPALALVMAASLGIGWLVLLPDEFAMLGKHALGGGLFSANLVFWREAGYFDVSARSKALLHLWSLGIEEQFYIAWPPILIVAWKRTKNLLPVICALAIASLALNLALIERKPSATFYLPVTRAWELLVGGALACWSQRRRVVVSRAGVATGLSALGAIMIGAALVLLTDKSPFPGWWAILPSVGTALIIAAGPGAWINRRILSPRPSTFVGQISYPLYLWHWPLLVFLWTVNASDWKLSGVGLQLASGAALITAGVLSWGTWRILETPCRRSANAGQKVRRLAVALSVVCSVAALCMVGRAMPRMSDPRLIAMLKANDWKGLEETNFKRSSGFVANEIRSPYPTTTLFVGDSHVEQYWPKAKAEIEAGHAGTSATFVTCGGCPPLPNLNRDQPGYHCPDFNRHWMSVAAEPRVRNVVIAAYWETYFVGEFFNREPHPAALVTADGKEATAADIDDAWRAFGSGLEALVRSGKRVFLLSSSPASPTFDPRGSLLRLRPNTRPAIEAIPRANFERFIAPTESRLERLASATGAVLIRPTEYFCSGTECPGMDADGTPLYRDPHHLRFATVRARAAFVSQLLEQ